jgi:hypothetical protein
MKTSVKIVGGICLGLILTHVIAGAIRSNIPRSADTTDSGDTFASQIERANNDCPIPFANGDGQVSAIRFENDNVTYYLDYNKGHIDLETFNSNPEAARELFYLSFVCLNAQGNQSSIFRAELKRRGYGVKVVVGDGSGRRFESELSADYLTKMDNSISSDPHEALQQGLALKMRLESAQLPQQIDEGLTLTKSFLDRGNIVSEIAVDEDLYDISALRENKDALAEAILQSGAHDSDAGAMLDLCLVSHTGLIYRMIGDKSKQSVDVVLTSEYISGHRGVPSQLNLN